MIDVSLVVPVYKVEAYIRRSVRSMLDQTHRNIEVILVDDGSPDASGDICDEFAAADSRVKVIHKANNGTGLARQSGMDAAEGEYVYFCDPDDILEPNLIEENFELAKRFDADIVEFGHKRVRLSGNGEIEALGGESLPSLDGLYDNKGFWETFGEREAGYNYLFMHMFRLDFIRDNDIRHTPLSTAQDTYFLYCVYAAPFKSIYYNRKCYYNYLVRQGSAMTSLKPERIKNEYACSVKFEEVVKGSSGNDGRYDALILRNYIRGLSVSIGSITRSAAPLGEKVQLIKEVAEKENMKAAVKKIPLGALKDPIVKIKVVFLKLGMYKSVVRLGEIFNKLKK